jgi:glycine cleavage system H protein
MRPNDRKYLKSHEWCLVEDGVATIGISDYAVKHLEDLVFLDLPEVGSQVSAGTSFGEIESVKAVSDLYSPVSGEVVETNEALVDDIESLNSDNALHTGWMLKVKFTEESADLMDAAAYEECLKNEVD